MVRVLGEERQSSSLEPTACNLIFSKPFATSVVLSSTDCCDLAFLDVDVAYVAHSQEARNTVIQNQVASHGPDALDERELPESTYPRREQELSLVVAMFEQMVLR